MAAIGRNVRRIPCPKTKAEGLCDGVPYDTQIVSADGCCVHFWMGADSKNTERLRKLIGIAKNNRDVVEVTFSDGEPDGFWTKLDMS